MVVKQKRILQELRSLFLILFIYCTRDIIYLFIHSTCGLKGTLQSSQAVSGIEARQTKHDPNLSILLVIMIFLQEVVSHIHDVRLPSPMFHVIFFP